MTILHPRHWELTRSSGPDEQMGRCSFSDRLHERLDVRWRGVKYVPEMAKLLAQHRKKKGVEEGQDVTDLEAPPQPWVGVLRGDKDAATCQAGRCFRDHRLLAEVTMVWPGQRDAELENAILAGIEPQDPHADVRRWQALGISMDIGAEFDLRNAGSKVGLVRWVFATESKRDGQLTVERFAMPDTWLKTPLRDWLVKELPADHRLVRQDPVTVGAHRGEQLTSHRRIGTVSALRGLREVRLTRAWVCPVESRLYRLTFQAVSRDEEVPLPESVQVRCCRDVATVAQTPAGT